MIAIGSDTFPTTYDAATEYADDFLVWREQRRCDLPLWEAAYVYFAELKADADWYDLARSMESAILNRAERAEQARYAEGW